MMGASSASAARIDPSIVRRALVTGGARRVGRAIGLGLAQAGFEIVLHCRRAEDAVQTASDIRAIGRDCLVLAADLADEREVASLVSRAGALGVLVNNASVFEPGEWDSTDRAGWDVHLETNLRAPFVLMQDFARQLPQQAHGAVINLLDQRVQSLTPHFVAYTVSKYGLWGLTQSMALALAPRIRVNAIGPGPALPSPRQSQAQFEAQCGRLPLQRGTDPAEIADAVLAILAMRSMTGQMLALDGGQHLQWGPATAPAVE